MKLSELEARFIKYISDREYLRVDAIAEATGVQFLCPKCFQANNGPVGTHMVICWDPSVPQSMNPKPGRWKLVGTSLEDLTLVAASSSILLPPPCAWHGYVTKGDAS